ncbi:unnamed protein product [Lupinus luteus]|uniref:Uncharacterized protein n=1 Tax=Lupinus luteus TaxID=3873 RepID=A0AAV1XSM4_LUPLU
MNSQRKHFKRMSKLWKSLKKSLYSEWQSKQVHDPMRTWHHNKSDQRNKPSKTSHSKKARPTSQRSSALSSSVINNFLCCHFPQNNEDSSKGVENPPRPIGRTIVSEKTNYVVCDERDLYSKSKVNVTVNRDCSPLLREKMKSLVDIVDKHDAPVDYSVVKLHKEDSSWQIVEKICQTTTTHIDSKIDPAQIECVLKVLNHEKTLSSFEECREMAKSNAENLQDRLPRCLADGNEILRFHGTAIACSLGMNDGSCDLPCTFDHCGLCQILRHGFSTEKEEFQGAVGVLTTSTSDKAFDSIGSSYKDYMRRCVIVCRVIAGRIHNPLQEIQEVGTSDLGFDSLVKKKRVGSDVEELHVLNPSAILPCFVVTFKFCERSKILSKV